MLKALPLRSVTCHPKQQLGKKKKRCKIGRNKIKASFADILADDCTHTQSKII